MNAVVTILLGLAPFVTSQFDITVTPIPQVCNGEPLPSVFNLTCVVNDTSASLSWLISGNTNPLPGPISSGSTSGYYMYPMPSVDGEATLIVLDPTNAEIVNGTCFQCRARRGQTVVSDSEPNCVQSTGPTICTRTFTLLSTSSTTISVMLNVSECRGNMPSYDVIAIAMTSGEKTEGMKLNATVFEISALQPETGYYIRPVDPACPNVVFEQLSVNTNTSANSTSPPVSSASSTTASPPPISPPARNGTSTALPVGVIVGCSIGGLIAVALIVITMVVAVLVFKRLKKNKTHGEKLTARHGEEMVDMQGDTTYAAPDKDKTAAEGGDGGGVYSYAATTTVVGAKHTKPGAKPGGEKKVAEDVSAQPEKPMRSSKKQPPPADVSHKQGPVGDLYAMPDKKAPEVGHVTGPQGDMYAVAAKPSKGDYGAEGPN